MPIKPPIRPATEAKRPDKAPTPVLGTAPVPKEIQPERTDSEPPHDTELAREQKVFDERAKKSSRHA